MKKIKVPREKCPLDIIAELGEETYNSWIFLHSSCIRKLKKSKGVVINVHKGSIELLWEATDKFPETRIVINSTYPTKYKPVISIEADDIAFKDIANEPKEVFFLKMNF